MCSAFEADVSTCTYPGPCCRWLYQAPRGFCEIFGRNSLWTEYFVSGNNEIAPPEEVPRASLRLSSALPTSLYTCLYRRTYCPILTSYFSGEIASVLLEPQSLYIMTPFGRFEWAHEILPGVQTWQGKEILRGRRISLIFRDQPGPSHEAASKYA